MELHSALEQPCSPGRVLSAFHSFAFSSLLKWYAAISAQLYKQVNFRLLFEQGGRLVSTPPGVIVSTFVVALGARAREN